MFVELTEISQRWLNIVKELKTILKKNKKGHVWVGKIGED